MKIKEPSLLDLLAVVEKLNDEMADKMGDWRLVESAPTISLTIVPPSKKWGIIGFVAINLTIETGQEFQLYNSVDDDRAYYEKSDTYESWYKYIKRKWKQQRESYVNIKL